MCPVSTGCPGAKQPLLSLNWSKGLTVYAYKQQSAVHPVLIDLCIGFRIFWVDQFQHSGSCFTSLHLASPNQA